MRLTLILSFLLMFYSPCCFADVLIKTQLSATNGTFILYYGTGTDTNGAYYGAYSGIWASNVWFDTPQLKLVDGGDKTNSMAPNSTMYFINGGGWYESNYNDSTNTYMLPYVFNTVVAVSNEFQLCGMHTLYWDQGSGDILPKYIPVWMTYAGGTCPPFGPISGRDKQTCGRALVVYRGKQEIVARVIATNVGRMFLTQ